MSQAGNSNRITRNYLDSLLIETRYMNSDNPDTGFKLYGEMFASPVMTAALSHLEQLGEGGMARVPQFEHGGMTSGGISGSFWMNVGIPQLKQRLENVNRTPLCGSAAEEEGEKGI